jgi:hypothetical protein
MGDSGHDQGRLLHEWDPGGDLPEPSQQRRAELQERLVPFEDLLTCGVNREDLGLAVQ